MTNSVLVVAPHPDDETLGCGGTLLRLAKQGASINWLIVTDMTDRYTDEQRKNRTDTIKKINKAYGFNSVHQLKKPTAELDTLPMSELIKAIGDIFNKVEPELVLLPHRGDVHSDHRVVFDACTSCSKWFRYPFIKRMMSYETLSETDFSLIGKETPFLANVYFDINEYLAQKLEIMAMYSGECGEFPFPRSIKALTAQAHLRGAQSGYLAAEAFMLLREYND